MRCSEVANSDRQQPSRPCEGRAAERHAMRKTLGANNSVNPERNVRARGVIHTRLEGMANVEVGVIAFGVRTTLCVFESPMCEGAANFSAGSR